MLSTGELARDIGTILVGKEAVDCGLIDEVGGLKEALDALRAMIDAKEAQNPDNSKETKRQYKKTRPKRKQATRTGKGSEMNAAVEYYS